MPSDGRLWFNTKIDNSNVEKDLKSLERKIERSQASITKSENAKLPLAKQLDDVNKKLTEAKQNLANLKADLSAAQSAMAPGASAEDYIRASSDLPGLEQAVADQEKEVASLQKQWDSTNAKVEKYDREILQANSDIERSKAKASELGAQMNANGTKMQVAFDKAHHSAQKFGKRLLAIGKSALIFNVVYRALRSVANYMGKVLKTNPEYTAQLAKLKGALLTAFQPIYEFVLPGVIAVLKVLTSIVQVVANVISAFTGKTASQSAKDAAALNKEANAIDKVGGAAKEAKKQLMGFDELNKLEANESGAGGGGGDSAGVQGISPDFSDFNTDEYKAKIDEFTVYLSGALLALGAILAFSGVNIPLGIALMAAGAIGLVAVVKENWGAMSSELQNAITNVLLVLGTAALAIGAILAFSGVDIPKGIALMAIGAASLAGAAALNWDTIVNALQGPIGAIVALASTALLAIGLVLAFSGVALPLGIALIAVGAAGLVTVTALNWNSIVEALQGPIGGVVAIVSGILLVLGLILAFSGVGLPLGIALICAGAAGLVTVTALNWNGILEKLRGAWNSIKQWFSTNVAPKLTLAYWKEKFTNIADGLKEKLNDGINAAIGLFNSFISWINSVVHFSWGEFSAFGQTIIPAGSLQLFTIPQIPYLAQGAVIPPNKEFLAVLGDQKNGTNIEAPLSTIEQALRNVLSERGDGDININFTGDLAQLARILYPEIHRQERNTARARGW